MSKPFFTIFLVFAITSFLFGETASTGKITGVAVHSGNQEPLPGASVFVLGTNIGTATDA